MGLAAVSEWATDGWWYVVGRTDVLACGGSTPPSPLLWDSGVLKHLRRSQLGADLCSR